MEEQFILRVPPSVSERIDRLLSEKGTSEDNSLDLSFSEDGRNGTFVIGNDRFPVSLLDLPCIVESYKTYDDNVLIKTADIGQIITVREEGDPAPDNVEYRHGLTPPMRDARRRRFRREPDINPEFVDKVERDIVNILTYRGTTENVGTEATEHEDANGVGTKNRHAPSEKPENTGTRGADDDPDRSESDDSDD
ncbi:transcription initiation factor TFIID subunit 7 isoform X1 [Nymphaea colorata]|nr:transcription initiation factor TFIID subunit 7 isoform X1 [Nymphaea colorata]XP_031504772.1 transcription initiation factor TFIID subunit 7 isoform X1 [Nymphaea colorata]XP_031504773.1 transcription initiation factor TFIID subunit 7 isoform X1 [Nymphaea colorata]XP_031504774.1 transcription initiation factor TFIID subunit 7 isoform X1 [Nymphaea colorata]XP_049931113.1 transcription initiation factor TFIID subunit 7 isoform X1 [Nymphaea colorata]